MRAEPSGKAVGSTPSDMSQPACRAGVVRADSEGGADLQQLMQRCRAAGECEQLAKEHDGFLRRRNKMNATQVKQVQERLRKRMKAFLREQTGAEEQDAGAADEVLREEQLCNDAGDLSSPLGMLHQKGAAPYALAENATLKRSYSPTVLRSALERIFELPAGPFRGPVGGAAWHGQ